MPIELKPKTSKTEEEAPEANGLTLFNEDGELTLPGETIADFLESADFSAVTESPDALHFLSNPAACADDPYVGTLAEDGEDDDADDADDKEKGDDKGDDADADSDSDDDDADTDDKEKGDDADAPKDGESGDEPVAEVALPGAVAARLVDEADLTEMFGYYLDQLAEVEDPSLQEQAVLAVFEDYRDEDGGILADQCEEIAGMLCAVLTEGIVYDAAEEIDERIMTKGARRKASKIRRRPKSGKRRQELKKRRREEGRGAKKAKIGRQHKMRSRRKQSRIKQLARESEQGTMIFGLGDGINGANLRIGLSEDPNLEFTTDELIEFDVLAGSVFECPNEDCDSSHPFTAYLVEAKHKKKAKKKMDKDGDYDDSTHEADGMCPDCGEEIESMLDEKGKVPDAFKKHMKKKKGDNGDDDDDDADDGNGNGNGKKKKGNPFGKKNGKNGKKDETLFPSRIPGPFSIAAGRPNLSEGHSLAASTLALMSPPRTLTEDED